MRDMWFISDTHFNHTNILRFEDDNGDRIRGQFDSIQDMNETIIANWNSVVKDGDLVYHLGDVFFGAVEEYHEINSRLNGRKRLIVGNHDGIVGIVQRKFFQKIQMWRMFPEHGILLTHVPVHESTLFKKSLTNVHGHIHQNCSPTEYHINVSVEVRDYTPVHLDELANR